MSRAKLNRAFRQYRRQQGRGPRVQVASVNGSNYVPGRNNYVWVRNVGGDGSARGNTFPLRLDPGRNYIVRTGRILRVGEVDGELRAIGNDVADLDAAGISARQTNATDDSHRFTLVENLVNLSAFLSSTLVNAYNSMVRLADGRYRIMTPVKNIDVVTDYQPATATDQCIVCLWRLPDGDTLLTKSDDVAQTTDLFSALTEAERLINQCATQAPASAIGIYAFVVRGDSTAPEKLHDLRGVIGRGVPESVQFVSSTATIASGHVVYWIGPVAITGTLTISGQATIV